MILKSSGEAVVFVDTNLVLFNCKLADQKSTLAQFLLCHRKTFGVLCIGKFTVCFLYLKNVEVAVKIDDKNAHLTTKQNSICRLCATS